MQLEAKNIFCHFQNREILSDFSMKMETGAYYCIAGKSGIGKTTLLNILTGMQHPDSGQVLLNGRDIYQDMKERERTHLRSRHIGYMNCANSLLENLTLYENIALPLAISGKKVHPDEIKEWFCRLGIETVMNSYPANISSGEYRRAGFARVLALDTEFLVFDEPTSNLDDESAEIIAKTIFSLKEKGILIATHDSRLMRSECMVQGFPS